MFQYRKKKLVKTDYPKISFRIFYQACEINRNKFSYCANTQKLCIITRAKCGHFSWHMDNLPCCLQLPVQFQRDSLTHRFVWGLGGLCKFPVFGMHSLHKWCALQDVNVLPFESENSELFFDLILLHAQKSSVILYGSQ